MMYRRSILATVICTTLAACGGSSSSSDVTTVTPEPTIEPTVEPTPEPLSFSGKAADGYLVDAKACLDLNANKQCDDDEPFATTGEGGVFTIEGVTQEQIDSAALLVEVIENVTKDEDNLDDENGGVIQKSYKLTAPAGSDFVSPITTLVQNEIEKGSTAEQAKETVKKKLGTTKDVSEDYVAAQQSEELTEEEKQEYATLHKIAQVTATVIADNTETLEQVAQSADISVEELTAIIVEEVNKALETIVEKVAEAEQNQGEVGEGEEEPDFDPTTIAAEIDEEHIDLDEENLKDKIDENEAEKSATAADLGELLKGDGIHWFYGEKEADRELELEYGNLQLDDEGNAIETIYYLNETMDGFEMEVMDADGEEDDYLQRMLTADGWVTEDDDIVSVNINDDGSIELVMQTPALNETATAKQVNIGDLKVAVVLAESGGNGAWSKVLPKDATFPADTMAYRLKTESSIEQYYSFHEGDWCDDDRKSKLNGMCNGAEIVAADGTRSWAQSLDEFIGQKHYVMGFDQAEGAVELSEDGKVHFYSQKWGEAEFTKLEAVGTWQDITVHGETLREIVLPDSIAMRDDIRWNNFNEEDNKQYLTVVDNYVRVTWSETRDSADGEYVFDKATQEYIVNKFDFDLYHPKTLASCLASLADKGYVAKVGDEFEQYTEITRASGDYSDTFKRYETFKTTSLTGSWLQNTKDVTGLPSWVEDMTGDLQVIFWSAVSPEGDSFGHVNIYQSDHTYYGEEMVDGDGNLVVDEQGNYSGWGIARAGLFERVPEQMVLNQPVPFSYSNFSTYPLYNAEPGADVKDYITAEFNGAEEYLGKETISIPAGQFDACKVRHTSQQKGYDGHTYEETYWKINRAMLKLVAHEMSPDSEMKTTKHKTRLPRH
ncbi:hypothetical protein [Motilimonas eburnea]|uniref:hypothetical protein n=1 Tax=Motilimonas eburnea TaxID=1737488 RepID=UPI001E646DD8|nr:hypothetical protein [Motilimonas eburnea]MCE2570889.1 hypothetical protein [Motilimonas eburnea]